MVQLNFDANQVEPDAGMDVVPAGWYNVAVDETEMKPTKSGDGAYLKFRFNILDGQYHGRKLFINLNLRNPNPQTVEIAQRQLSAICHATGVLNLQDTQQLYGIPLKVKVSVRKDSTGQYEDQNDIKSFKNINEQVDMAGGPAPQQQQGFQQSGGFQQTGGFQQSGGNQGGGNYQPQQGGQQQGFQQGGQQGGQQQGNQGGGYDSGPWNPNANQGGQQQGGGQGQQGYQQNGGQQNGGQQGGGQQGGDPNQQGWNPNQAGSQPWQDAPQGNQGGGQQQGQQQQQQGQQQQHPAQNAAPPWQQG